MNDIPIIQEMVSSILTQVKKAIDKEGHYDKTFTAKVVNILSNNRIEALYNGTIVRASSSIQCNTGDFVRICAPQNNWGDLFVLINMGQGR